MNKIVSFKNRIFKYYNNIENNTCLLFSFFIFHILFEIFSYHIMNKVIGIGTQYDYMNWVYYFYFPEKKIVFYFYLYFLTTTGLLYVLFLLFRVREVNLNINCKKIIFPLSFIFLIIFLIMIKYSIVLFIIYILGLIYAYRKR